MSKPTCNGVRMCGKENDVHLKTATLSVTHSCQAAVDARQ